jgi:V/A-type H+-transporting ATPase subunit I
MIVPMQRLTLLCLASDRNAALRRLQDLGVVHVVNARPPDSRALETARTQLGHINRVLETLPKKTVVRPSGLPGDVVVSLAWTMLQDRKDIEDALAALRQERARIAPFGVFDPAMVAGLHRHGVVVTLYVTTPELEPVAPEGAVLVEIARDKTAVYRALVARDEAVALEGLVPFRMPDQGMEAIDAEIAELEIRLADCLASLAQHEGDHDAVAALRDQVEDQVHFLEARDGMGSAAPVAYLRGFLPAERVGEVMTEARAHGWGVQVHEPEPGDEVPTLVRNPRWVRPIETVLRGINVLPGYREVDMSAVFLVFFSLFFAILIGDAGYGALFLVLTRYFRRKHPDAPAEPFALLTLTSICTMVWGVLTGTYFGAARIPGVLEAFRIDWLTDTSNMMSLCFLIGAVHLTIAHLWNIVRQFPDKTWLAQAGWIAMTWTMYFLAHQLVLDRAMPGGVTTLAIVGVVLIALFMVPVAKLKEEGFQLIMLPLNIVSNFVDVVSYLRLYAVGFASLAVAQAFNEMALGGGVAGPVAALGAALILFAGHALNIVLGAMGILVHGVRLNTLEFSSHLGVQWAGQAYAPFAHKRTPPGPGGG